MSRLSLCSIALTSSLVVDGAGFVPGVQPSGLIDNNGRCFIAGDIVILQDTTGSFMDDMPIVRAQIPDLIERVGAEFPGTLFGIAEFRDKPYFPLGELNDFCYKLRFGQLTNNSEMLQFAWDILQPSGGGDWYESQFQAGIDVVNDATVGWRPFIPGAYNITTKQAGDESALREAIELWETGQMTHSGARIVVLITDAEPHIPGDMAMCAPGVPGWEPSWYCPQNLPKNPGVIVDDDFEATCRDYDYPTEKQFVDAALKANVLFVFLTTADVAPFYRRLTTEQFKNPEELTQIISDDSSNLTEALMKALKVISEVGCEHFPTTTSTTTAPATTATTESEEATTTVTTGTTATTTTITTTTTQASTTPPTTTSSTTTATTTTTAATTIENAAVSTAGGVETVASTTAITEAASDTTTTTATTSVAVDTTEGSTTTTSTTATSATNTVSPTGPTGMPAPPAECPECPPCAAEPCPPCPCVPACAPHCDDLVIKIGAQVAKLDLSYEN